MSGSSKESSVILTSLLQSPEEMAFSKKRETVILGLVQLGFEEKTASKEVDKVLKIFSSNDPGEIIREILKSL
ncbi:RuvA, C-terminal domain protein [Leptospira interrogans serovar Icterohaemorrhagiae str. Verdun HP]|uniref:RuvA, C-terminal domain protein n=1 Tax=Leptospira interrogans serovar Icterohaemorrhagiae str. Verdun HP TaxID=1049910 RepID=M6RPE2_LEPIR|nr:RuvA, C-terminal domain protein [Leptospira interrogans serovar Icterohaemorrhagiae str. Verdun HP]KPA33855.1 Holliday junction ATP-dependent DNA helicase RuvA [Leptospira interrogans]OBZ99926.1 Holliday junction ATP-dependent DNA helicase RuvA [Leptospira interrogans serovar Copenhageni/Icterohaemorrhagiae]